MDINQLYYFLTVCDEMNYTRASERLYISRQALVKSIHKLEEEFGYPLFYVTKNKLSLAPFGQHLLTQGAPIADAFQHMNATLISTFEDSCQPIPIWISRCILPFIMPDLPTWLADFQKEYPNFSMEIREFDDECIRSAEDLENGVYLIVRMPETFPGTCQITLQSKPLLLHMNTCHPLAHQQTVRLEDLSSSLFCSPGDPSLYLKELNDAYRNLFGRNLPCRIIREGGEALNAVRKNELISLGINLSEGAGAQSVPFSTKLLPIQGHHFLWNVEMITLPEYAKRPLVQILMKYIEKRAKKNP